eukprot:TRINITY_DN7753_c0_g2_i2.p1 TRINITY_DN7753_c0_g2~~TRINITY_DN7753_c0_g2_i2.p1  ORF type:complete len:373 (+),score=160.01 TRINITY_DN7753_c0_g2_i2:1149-2267(+)
MIIQQSSGSICFSTSSLVKEYSNIQQTIMSYTKEEVEKHIDPEDCWIIIKDKVYHVTADYLEEHPGEAEAILDYAGEDATEAFYEDVGHSDKAIKKLQGFFIGNLVEGNQDNQQEEEIKEPEAEPQEEKEEKKEENKNEEGNENENNSNLLNKEGHEAKIFENISENKAYCRCWQSKNFPFCDGSHHQYNKETNSNVGPVVVTVVPKKEGASEEKEEKKEENNNRESNEESNENENNSNILNKEGHEAKIFENISENKAYCRCWQSKNFPFCDGSHHQYNKETNSNVGPVVVTIVPKKEEGEVKENVQSNNNNNNNNNKDKNSSKKTKSSKDIEDKTIVKKENSYPWYASFSFIIPIGLIFIGGFYYFKNRN